VNFCKEPAHSTFVVLGEMMHFMLLSCKHISIFYFQKGTISNVLLKALEVAQVMTPESHLTLRKTTSTESGYAQVIV
jgi:hypothetical protein